MKAIRLVAPGDRWSSLQYTDLPIPEIRAANEILVRVHAAGVNPIDCKLQKKGSLFPENLPIVPGCEGSGVVQAVGPGVTGFSPGDQVVFMYGGFGTTPGTFAEYTIVPETSLCKKPSTMTMEQAACFPLTLITAWESLHTRGKITKNDKILIHAGAGGVGQMAIQLAKCSGAQIFTSVRGEENKRTILHQKQAILLDSEQFEEQFLEKSGGHGPDLILDTIGGSFTSRSLSLLAPYGRLVTLLEEHVSMEDAIASKRKNLTLHWIQALTPNILKLEPLQKAQTDILKKGAILADAGKLSIHIGQVFLLKQASEAMDLIESGHHHGRIVLSMGVKED